MPVDILPVGLYMTFVPKEAKEAFGSLKFQLETVVS